MIRGSWQYHPRGGGACITSSSSRPHLLLHLLVVVVLLLVLPFHSSEAVASTSSTPSLKQKLKTAVEPLISRLGQKYNFGISYGFRGLDHELKKVTAAVAGGPNKHLPSETTPYTPDPALALTTAHAIPMGSVTKTFTAIRILQLVDDGILSLNDTVHDIIDPILVDNLEGATMLSLFESDTRVEDITIYQLLHMSSGIQDYDDSWLKTWTLLHPNQDQDPFSLLTSINKTLLYTPGEGGAYSSIGTSLTFGVLSTNVVVAALLMMLLSHSQEPILTYTLSFKTSIRF